MLEDVGLWRGVGRLDEAGDIDRGQAAAVFVVEQAVVVEHARGQRGRAEQWAQLLDVIQVVEGDGPAETAKDLIQIAGAGGRLPGGVAADVQQRAIGRHAVLAVPFVGRCAMALDQQVEKALAQRADGVAGMGQLADLLERAEIARQFGQAGTLCRVAADGGVAQGQQFEAAGAVGDGAVAQGRAVAGGDAPAQFEGFAE
ncbi:hypothetical protein D3C72_1203160 [compost metagenome]